MLSGEIDSGWLKTTGQYYSIRDMARCLQSLETRAIPGILARRGPNLIIGGGRGGRIGGRKDRLPSH